MPVMWSTISALFVAALWAMAAILEGRGISFSFGQWAIYLAWLLWALFSVAYVWTSLGEDEPRAAGVGGVIFGGLALVVGGILAQMWFV